MFSVAQVEEDLKKMIEVWQKENEGFFFVNGEKYLELIKTQQEERKRNKDLVKLGKVYANYLRQNI